MIKIQINNILQKKQDYLDAILNSVAFRVSILQKSLSHLNGDAIDFSNNDLDSFRAITKKIILIVRDDFDIPNGRVGYSNGMKDYRAIANSLAQINLNGLIEFCRLILANNKALLSELLICDAVNLMKCNEAILNYFGLNTIENIKVIKLAFDYQVYNDDIGSPIRQYFRKNQFVKICPYCNIDDAWHNLNDFDEVVDSYHLDHFYDKATYPLLAYCLFNLVPSDINCNVTNKGTAEFSETYHLNPHEDGYHHRINFIPIGLTPSFDVSKIGVTILETPGTSLYAKINGNNPPNEERNKLGNLNVFKIRSKYKNEKRRARDIFEKLHSNNKNLKHISIYLKSLRGLDKEQTYVEWYKDKVNDSFYSETFNDNSYSKFCRDIHDHYYSLNGTRFNGYITDLIDLHK